VIGPEDRRVSEKGLDHGNLFLESGEERGEGAHVRGEVLVAASLVVIEPADVAELEGVF